MKDFFTNTPIGVGLYFIFAIAIMILCEYNTTFLGLIVFAFYGFIILLCNNYVILSILFIIPMSKKYKIIASDLPKNNTRYIITAFLITLMLLFFLLVFNINIYIFILALGIFFLQSIHLIIQYKNYTILHYIAHFSPDLFNWYKIYKLPIDDELKKKCFQIYNIDITYYKKLYEEYKELEIQQKIFESKQMRLEFNKNTKEY